MSNKQCEPTAAEIKEDADFQINVRKTRELLILTYMTWSVDEM